MSCASSKKISQSLLSDFQIDKLMYPHRLMNFTSSNKPCAQNNYCNIGTPLETHDPCLILTMCCPDEIIVSFLQVLSTHHLCVVSLTLEN